MGKENLEAGEQSPEHQGAEEFQRSLQSDDTVSYGKRLAEIILDALRGKVPWRQPPSAKRRRHRDHDFRDRPSFARWPIDVGVIIRRPWALLGFPVAY